MAISLTVVVVYSLAKKKKRAKIKLLTVADSSFGRNTRNVVEV